MNPAKYHTPGVYFERFDPAPRAIVEVRSDIAGFVGVSERGPLHRAVRVNSWIQYRSRFGDPCAEGLLASAVYGFFANGGRMCWVVRVGTGTGARPAAAEIVLRDELALRVQALDRGPHGADISVRVDWAEARSGSRRFSLRVSVRGEMVETWSDLSLERDDPAGRYYVDLVNGRKGQKIGAMRPERERENLPSFRGSVLIQIEEPTLSSHTGRKPDVSKEVALTGGDPVLAGLTLEHFTGENLPPGEVGPWGLACLESVPEVNLVAVPDLVWFPTQPPRSQDEPRPAWKCNALVPDVIDIEPELDPRRPFSESEQRDGQRAIIRQCARLQDRFALLDAPSGPTPDLATPNRAIDWAESLRSDKGQYAALYYPWLLVDEPGLKPGDLRLVPPSGHVAGVAARVDLSTGVQKPPANERIENAHGVEPRLDAATHGQLNAAAVNAIVPAPGRGIRVAGARTLTDRDHAEWLYVNVRRLLIMIEQSIEQSTQWVVFEPNRPDRWREVDRVVRNFLDDQWRSGRLDGATANEAYSVQCDDETNTRAGTDAGRLVCQIGVQPPRPAEFVVVRIGRSGDLTGTTGEGRDVSG